MHAPTLDSLLTALEQDEFPNFTTRQNVFGLITAAQDFLQANPETLPASLTERLNALHKRLTDFDLALFQHIRTDIRQGHHTPQSLRAELEQLTSYTRWNPRETRHTFDNLDVLLDGILQLDDAPFIYQPTADLEMVYYLPTPARIILTLADYTDLKPDDVFYDLGSGAGRVPLLLHLITGLHTKGVEFNPKLHELAECGRTTLNISAKNVTFIEGDARTADYSDGTIFYMFTPFQGEMFQTVLDRLKQEALQRPIRVYAHGGCIPTVKEQAWLREQTPTQLEAYRMAVFYSRPV
jgi:Histone methylation protein DOT1